MTLLAILGSTELSIFSFHCILDSRFNLTIIAESPSIFLNNAGLIII